MGFPIQGASNQQSLVSVSSTAMPSQDVLNQHSLSVSSSGETLEPEHNFSSQGQPGSQGGHTTEVGLVVLSTARLVVFDCQSRPRECRALLDSGSQSSFITNDLARRLGLPVNRVHVPVSGINQSITPVTHVARTTIKSRINNFQAQLSFLVLNSITQRLPAVRLDRSILNIPENLTLADPSFALPGPIDMLIGAELFWDLLCVGQIRNSYDLPILQKTKLGWIVSGRFNQSPQRPLSDPTACFLAVHQDLQDKLQQFWVIEEATPTRHLSPEEASCEAHFVKTTKRDVDGRFIVKLPFRADPVDLGESRHAALNRLAHLERKFIRDPGFHRRYTDDINDYRSEGHMKEVLEPSLQSVHRPVFYLPHHAVHKEQGASNKLRVVFDASAPSTNGHSLNSLLKVGPTIQDDLQSIVIRFRSHRHVITADVIKMYRQIKVHPDDVDCQRILWRPIPHGPIATYQLQTVTFGTSAAPFLATRCLYQLALDNRSTYPETSTIIARDFYVDDLLTGASTRTGVTRLKAEIIQILAQAGMKLHKWNSTCQELRDAAAPSPDGSEVTQLLTQPPVKTLGIFWDSENDHLSYRVKQPKTFHSCTKRIILTVIAGLFDPLGLLGPILVYAKILMQQLWELKTGWDESVPQDIFTSWQSFESGLTLLNGIKIPRRVTPFENPIETHLHGFSDASEKAYGACVYICTVDQQGSHSSHLLCARSRVAPLKTVTIPRLELCSALLLAQLVNKVTNTLIRKPITTTMWSDSTVALAWIASSPHRWKVFIANRVAEIHTLNPNSEWCHVDSGDNPADLLSRGCTPSQMTSTNSLWWHGPVWLRQDRQSWPTQPAIQPVPREIAEHKTSTTALVSIVPPADIFARFSSLYKLVNVVAYCLRFKHNCQSPADKKTGALQVSERHLALHHLISLAQKESFKQEICLLSKQEQLQATSRLLSLSPFLDEAGLLRVGGRIQRATVPEDQRHPLLLPPNHPITRLIIRDAHSRSLHAGTIGTLAAVRQKYWPLSGRRAIQGVIRNCITCFRVNPRYQTPAMGQLPASRVNPSRPFSTCGVDFAGPFMLRQGGPRSKTRIKSYMAVFVCFATRATHLELVSALSSEAFLACLKRFIGRRGKPYQVFSDNGTNFTGANNELRNLSRQFHNGECVSKVTPWLAENDILWNFIPPASPHFGGIWEAAVKAAKRHLLPVVGNAALTFEELATLLIQIESCLNSRPISPMSSDPNDLSVLTPGHFLIGGPLTAVGEPSLQHLPLNRLSRWQRTQQLTQHFWTRWSSEYLCQLQQRQKWCKSTPPVVIGSLVLMREDNTPPLKWPLGRVTEVHPGRDGVVRVATVRTIAGTFRRAVIKLCVLPLKPDL